MNKALLAIFIVASSVSGCTGVRLVDNQVSSFAARSVAPGSSYRFERLPSQQAEAAAQDRLERSAEAALARVGLKRADTSATLIAQVLLTQRVEIGSIDRPAFGWGFGWFGRHGGISLGHGPLFPGLDERPNYWREVRLTLRDVATQTVVFETRASHDGPWSDSAAIVPAMLDAALQGFPDPPQGERRVNIEIAR
ncbi:MAG: DUF4136 domain-containing protein [Rhodoferax sp.]